MYVKDDGIRQGEGRNKVGTTLTLFYKNTNSFSINTKLQKLE